MRAVPYEHEHLNYTFILKPRWHDNAGDQERRNAGMLERARCTGSAPHRRGACGSAEEGVPVGRAARKRAENLDECGEGLQLGKRVRNGGVARVACQLDEEGDLRAAPWRRRGRLDVGDVDAVRCEGSEGGGEVARRV